MPLSFTEFLHLGADQWRTQTHPLAAVFVRLLGPLGVHARIRNTRVLNALQGLDLRQARILDFGSGHGYSLFYLARRYPQARLQGLELDPQQVADCNQRAAHAGLSNLTFIRRDFHDLPEEALYDLVISIDVLEHVPDDQGMLDKMAAVLRPGGMAVIHVPLRHQLQQRVFKSFQHHTVEDHVRDEYLPEEIRQKIEAAGLVVLSSGYDFGWWGELAFELNNLFWEQRWLRNLAALCTLPISLAAGYADTRRRLQSGNALILTARKPGMASEEK